MQHTVSYSLSYITKIFTRDFLQGNVAANVTVDEYCQKQVGIKPEEKDLFIEQFDDSKSSTEPSESFYCYVRCVFKETGIINEEGIFSIKAYKKISEELVDEECLKNVPKISECEHVSFILMCE